MTNFGIHSKNHNNYAMNTPRVEIDTENIQFNFLPRNIYNIIILYRYY